jgi:predicted amidohydrolase
MRLILTQPALQAYDNAHSMAMLRDLACGVEGGLQHDDIVLLPEHVFFVEKREEYLGLLAALAKDFGCHVVGGSFHEIDDGIRRNTGAVFTPDGEVLGWYDKLRPYADERKRVDAGTRLGEFLIGGRRILILICADFWFSDLFLRARAVPDLVLVPALSVTRKPTPDYSRALWRHLAIARAYEFGVFVGISDWAHSSVLPELITSGVGGFADTTGEQAAAFYQPIASAALRVITPDFEALHRFQQDRGGRGFFWSR